MVCYCILCIGCFSLVLRMKNVDKSFTLLGRGCPQYFMSAQTSSCRGSQVILDHNQGGFGGLCDVSLQSTDLICMSDSCLWPTTPAWIPVMWSASLTPFYEASSHSLWPHGSCICPVPHIIRACRFCAPSRQNKQTSSSPSSRSLGTRLVTSLLTSCEGPRPAQWWW